MKLGRMIKALCIIFSLLVFRIACAQDYLVTVRNDTIRGELKLLNYSVEPRILISVPGSKKKESYSIIETKLFQLDNEIYETVRTPERYAFMKLIMGGYLSLYAFESREQPQWSGRYMATLDGRTMEVPNLGFKKRVGAFIEDCRKVSDRVTSGELGRNDIEEIIVAYNACINQRTKSAETISIPDAWEDLDSALEAHEEFQNKSDVIEMVREIKQRLKRSEKVPNFLLDGVKNYLNDQVDLLEKFETARKTIKD